MTEIDLTSLSVRALLELEAGVVTELRRRRLVRTQNKPLGDIAEQIVCRARGGVLAPNSTKSHDVETSDGMRIQVKAMGMRAAANSAKFSPFRSFDFDSAVFLVFAAPTFELALAREVSPSDIQARAGFSKHTNSSQPTLSMIRAAGRDVTAEMATAYASLDDRASARSDDGSNSPR